MPSEHERKKVLADFLGLSEDEMDELQQTTHDENAFDYGNETYKVYTDSEADRKAKEYIEESLWAFNPDFIAEHTKVGYSDELVQSIKAIQNQCEGANPAIKAMIDDINDFVEDAISTDGRGHFLSQYDGNEHDAGDDLFIYRD